MQNQEDRGKLPINMGLIGLPVDVKQYPLEHGWLVVSTVGMCFIPYPANQRVEKNEQRTEETTPQKVEGKKNGKR